MISRIDINADAAEGIGKRDLNNLIKSEFENRGKKWSQKFRKRHFSNVAYSLYGYRRRKRPYNAVKKRRFGHTLPLVFSGESRRRSESPRIRATVNGVKVTLNMPALNLRSKASNIDKRKEMTTVADSENKALDKINSAGIERRLKRYRKRKKIR